MAAPTNPATQPNPAGQTKVNKWLVPREEIEKPVRPGGVSPRTATKLRHEMAKFIRQLGSEKFVNIPQLAIATATLYMHRFFLRKDFMDHDRHIVAIACVLLAGKVEESPRKLKVILSKANQILSNAKTEDLQFVSTREFTDMREKVLIAERVLLQTISFDLMVQHPYRYLTACAVMIPPPPNTPDIKRFQQAIVQQAWTFVNDSYQTTLCLQYPATHIAVAASYLSCRTQGIDVQKMADGKQIYEVYDVKPHELEDMINQILDLYSKGHELVNGATPASVPAAASSPAYTQKASPSSASPAPAEPKPAPFAAAPTLEYREYSPASPNLNSPQSTLISKPASSTPQSAHSASRSPAPPVHFPMQPPGNRSPVPPPHLPLTEQRHQPPPPPPHGHPPPPPHFPQRHEPRREEPYPTRDPRDRSDYRDNREYRDYNRDRHEQFRERDRDRGYDRDRDMRDSHRQGDRYREPDYRERDRDRQMPRDDRRHSGEHHRDRDFRDQQGYYQHHQNQPQFQQHHDRDHHDRRDNRDHRDNRDARDARDGRDSRSQDSYYDDRSRSRERRPDDGPYPHRS